ncbi:hypothetical protein Taro_040438 [Colocasia esculenta]|uniref:Uncharacterized protein n=1 Tax=Colocasia esculenta TaxID=4460 RepID=A0A843WJ26_COLES|nr:hypothetical protein [Colocasia esculenta]
MVRGGRSGRGSTSSGAPSISVGRGSMPVGSTSRLTTLVVLATGSASRPTTLVVLTIRSASPTTPVVPVTEVENHHPAAEEVAQPARRQSCWISGGGTCSRDRRISLEHESSGSLLPRLIS